MFYEAELRILRDTFRKCRIHTAVAELSKSIAEHTDTEMHAFIAAQIDVQKPLVEYVPTVQPATIYRLRDPFDCRYTYLLLPEYPRDSVLVIGPYLPAPPEKDRSLEWAETHGISPAQLKQLESYYGSVPILPDISHLFTLLDSFAERLWGPGNVSVEDINQDFNGFPLADKADSEEADTLWNMKNMEQRYAYENALMEAVSKGQIHKADMLFSNFLSFPFEQRVTDPLRNLKNYCIIMNTLLRKAAEQGGVHPLYLDSTSSAYANRIELLHALESAPVLFTDMFRDYCLLVRKHSTQNYSPPVQKALLYIEANLAENLSLRTLAETLNVSSSYLSSLFRKETGQTLTDFINRRRVRHAMHLLKTTRLQVQTVAQHCGIMDVQYFSKIFKKVAGVTPKEYRDKNR
jgi:AraC-like DNA-binding protein